MGAAKVKTKTNVLILDADSQLFQVNKFDPMSFSLLDNRIGAITPEFGLLPPVVKYISPWKGGTSLVIVESRPRAHLIHWNGDDGEQAFILNLPWIHWFMHITQSAATDLTKATCQAVSMAFSKTQLQTRDHQFYPPWTPNILDELACGGDGPWAGWDICYGIFKKAYPISNLFDGMSLNQIFQQITADYFGTIFNREASYAAGVYIETLGLRVDTSLEKDLLRGYETLSKLSIADSIKLLDKIEVETYCHSFSDIYEHYEEDVNTFDFAEFMGHMRAMSEAYIRPKVLSSTAGPSLDLSVPQVNNLRDNLGWSEEDCVEEGSCPPNHYNEDGDHKDS